MTEVIAELQPTQGRVRRIAAALEELRLTAQQDPRPGSPRAVDIATAGSFAVAGFPGVWEDQPLESGHNNVMLALHAIGQELEGVARALDRVPLAYVDVVLTRSVIETAARAWWRLEPGLAARDRAGRHVTERLYDVHQAVRHFQDAPPPPGGNAPGGTPHDWIQRVADLKAAAKEAGFQVNNYRDSSYVDDQRRPSSTKLIERFFDVAGLGRAAYHDASAIVHGLPAGLLSRQVGTTGDRTRRFAMMGPDPLRIRFSAGLAMLATLALADRLIEYDALHDTQAGLAWSGIEQGVVLGHLTELRAAWFRARP